MPDIFDTIQVPAAQAPSTPRDLFDTLDATPAHHGDIFDSLDLPATPAAKPPPTLTASSASGSGLRAAYDPNAGKWSVVNDQNDPEVGPINHPQVPLPAGIPQPPAGFDLDTAPTGPSARLQSALADHRSIAERGFDAWKASNPFNLSDASRSSGDPVTALTGSTKASKVATVLTGGAWGASPRKGINQLYDKAPTDLESVYGNMDPYNPYDAKAYADYLAKNRPADLTPEGEAAADLAAKGYDNLSPDDQQRFHSLMRTAYTKRWALNDPKMQNQIAGAMADEVGGGTAMADKFVTNLRSFTGLNTPEEQQLAAAEEERHPVMGGLGGGAGLVLNLPALAGTVATGGAIDAGLAAQEAALVARGMAPAAAKITARIMANSATGSVVSTGLTTAQAGEQGRLPGLGELGKAAAAGVAFGPAGEVLPAAARAVGLDTATELLPAAGQRVARTVAGLANAGGTNAAVNYGIAKATGDKYGPAEAEKDVAAGIGMHLASGGAAEDVTAPTTSRETVREPVAESRDMQPPPPVPPTDHETLIGRLAKQYPDLKGNELGALAAEMMKSPTEEPAVTPTPPAPPPITPTPPAPAHPTEPAPPPSPDEIDTAPASPSEAELNPPANASPPNPADAPPIPTEEKSAAEAQPPAKTRIFDDPDVKDAWENMQRVVAKKTTFGGIPLDPEMIGATLKLGLAVTKAGARTFGNFVKELSENSVGRVRMLLIQHARDIYEQVRAHEDSADYRTEMTPPEQIPTRLADVARMATLTPAERDVRQAARGAAAAAPAPQPTEAATIKAAAVKPAETTKGTILRTTGVRSADQPTITEAQALSSKLKLMQKLLGKEPTAEEKAFAANTVPQTETTKGTILRTTGVRPEQGPVVPESKALAATLAIREAFTNKEFNASQAKEKVVEAAKDLPRAIRGDFITDIRDAKSQADVDRALAKMDGAVKTYHDKQATGDLYDQIGKPLKPKEPSAKTLAQKVNEAVGVHRPEDPFVGGRIKPEEQMPAARDALQELVSNLRSPDAPSAKGAGKLADFISSERDLGHSNDGGMTEEEIGKLRAMEGKKLAELSPDDKRLLTQAIAHGAFLGKEYNEAQVGSRAYRVRQEKNEMLGGMEMYHPEPLKPGSRGGVETAPKKNAISQFLGNTMRDPFRFLKLNFGEGGVKQWERLADAHTDTLGATNEAADRLKATLRAHGINDSRWRKMGETTRTIDLGDGQKISLTPREVIGFINGWGRDQTRAEMIKTGVVPDRMAHDRANNRPLTPETGQRIIDAATPSEKAIAKTMGEYLNNSKLRTDANAASVKEFGFEKLTEPNYWPRKRAMEQIPQRIPENMQQFQDGLLKDAGFLKAAKGSSAAVAIEDAGKTFDRHVKGLSNFAYLNEPIRDLMMIQNDPTFRRNTISRLGDGWDKQLTHTLTRLAGMEDSVSVPGARFANSVRSRIAAGELMFRITSAINHFTGGLLAVNQIPDGSRLAFLKNFGMKAVPDMATIRDMESRNAYLRNRATAHGENLETPVDTTNPTTKVGRVFQKAGDIGTMHIRFSDRMDSASVYKTLLDRYRTEHPGAAQEEAKNWAAKQTEYAVRKSSTASTPFENSYLSQRMSRIPGVNLLTLFQSKTSAMRNTLDEAYNGWRVEKSAANTKKLATAVGSVAAMMAVYAGVGAISKRVAQGFSTQSPMDKKKDNENEAVSLLAHAADVVVPGGGNLVRTIHGNTGGNIISETVTTAASHLMRAIDSEKRGHTEDAVENAVASINSAAKILGLSLEQPTQYAFGTYHALTDKPTTPATKMAQELRTKIIPGGEQSAEDADRLNLRNEIADTIRAGAVGKDGKPAPDVQKDIDAAVDEGKLTADDRTILKNTAKYNDLQFAVHGLTAENAVRVFDTATPEEKESLQEIVRDKVLRTNAKPAEQDKMMADHGITPPVDLPLQRAYAPLEKLEMTDQKRKEQKVSLERQIIAANAAGDIPLRTELLKERSALVSLPPALGGTDADRYKALKQRMEMASKVKGYVEEGSLNPARGQQVLAQLSR